MPNLQPPAFRRLRAGDSLKQPLKQQPPAIQRTFGNPKVDRAANKYKRKPK